jgi:hypothetical protein
MIAIKCCVCAETCSVALLELISLFLSAQDTTHVQTHDMLSHHRVDITSNSVIVLIYNFSKEQCMLREDNLRIETCRSVLNVIM